MIIQVAAFLISLAVLWLMIGKEMKIKTRYVRYKDEVFEKQKKVKNTQDRLVALIGGLVLAAVAYAITGVIYIALAGLCCGTFVLKWWKNKQEEEKEELLKSQFLDVLGQLESAMYGGLNPYQALEDSVPNMPRPARDIFYEILRRVRTGDTLIEAIESVRKEVNWDELKILSIGISLYSRVGCNLSEILRHSMENQEEKESFRAIVSASVAQNMMTLKVLTALPFLFVGLARVMAPGFAEPLFKTVEGVFMFAVATVWILVGNIFTRKMIKSALGQGV